MRAYQFPQPETVQETVVSSFGGRGFPHPSDQAAALTLLPDMQNMICDQNDYLVKRTGWQTKHNYGAPIYGLFPLPDNVGCAVHAGKKLYARQPDGTQTELCADMNEDFSQSFVMGGVLYLLDGATFRAVRPQGIRGWLGGCAGAGHRLCADHNHFRPAHRRRHQL